MFKQALSPDTLRTLVTNSVEPITSYWNKTITPLYSKDARQVLEAILIEQQRLDSLDHTGMTLDQLKTEHHVVSQRLIRGIYRDDTKADLEERQDKLLLSIKRKERHQ